MAKVEDYILVLDPAASTGYCIIEIASDINGRYANIYEYGFIDVDQTSNFQGDHCIDLMEKIRYQIDLHNITHIAIEDFFFSKKFANGSTTNAAYRTAIHIVARERNIDYTILNISAWKTFIAGSARPSKAQKKRWGAEAAKKLYIQQALYERYEYYFPNHSISNLTGKPIVFRYDIVDVVGQGIYYCGMILGIPKDRMFLSVAAAPDIQFKRSPKKLFSYYDMPEGPTLSRNRAPRSKKDTDFFSKKYVQKNDTVNELKQKLRELGLPVSGTKSVLQDRLLNNGTPFK